MAEKKQSGISGDAGYAMRNYAGASVAYHNPAKKTSAMRYHYNRTCRKDGFMLHSVQNTINAIEQYEASKADYEQHAHFYKMQEDALKKDPNAVSEDKRIEDPGQFQINGQIENSARKLNKYISIFHEEREVARTSAPTKDLFIHYTNSGKYEIKGISDELKKLISETTTTLGNLKKSKDQKDILLGNTMEIMHRRDMSKTEFYIAQYEEEEMFREMSGVLEQMAQTA